MNSPRDLPPVHALMSHPAVVSAAEELGRARMAAAVRQVIDEARASLLSGSPAPVDLESLSAEAIAIARTPRPGLRRVLNATGVLLHTGLGRAPLAAEAVEAIVRVAGGYCDLELDLETGLRGRRTSAVEGLLRSLTGAPAATVVNNNAAATLLTVQALAAGREVIVSRGELVEIGGSFRLPEIIETSGARLREVGTTNRTRLADFERAIGPETAAILRVHASNYQVVGFTERATLGELAGLARSRGLHFIDDLGSGALAPGLPPGLGREPTVSESLAAGADLVLFSGDKLLGGPQCGLILGRPELVRAIESSPLMRAVRVDKLTIAALEATLHLLLDPLTSASRLPLWSFLRADPFALRKRAERLAARLRDEFGLRASVVDSTSYLGGGSAPHQSLASSAVRLDAPFPPAFGSEAALATALRGSEPAVVCRVHDGALHLDPRALLPGEDDLILASFSRLLHARGAE